MTENYTFEYITNDPNQIYTTEVIETTNKHHNQYPTTIENYTYEIPQIYQPSQNTEAYTVVNKPQKIQYQPTNEQIIYTTESNKNKNKIYTKEYPITTNNKNNYQQIYQYDNNPIQIVEGNNDINYAVQQVQLKAKNKVDNNNYNNYISPQVYTNNYKQQEAKQIQQYQHQPKEKQNIQYIQQNNKQNNNNIVYIQNAQNIQNKNNVYHQYQKT